MNLGSQELRAQARQWHGSAPGSWAVRRFKEVATVREGQVDPEDDRYSALPLFAPNHIESGTGRILEVETATDQGAESGKYLVDAGDILYSKIRPALRKVALAPCAGLCSADMYPIKPGSQLDARFLFYSMLGEGFFRYSVLESARVAMPKINREALGECVLLIPSRGEQRAIADFLDRKTVAVDALIEKKERLLSLAEERRHATIWALVTKGLNTRRRLHDSGYEWMGLVPEHWAVAPVGARYEVQLGKMLNPDAASGDDPAPYLRNTDVQWGRINTDDLHVMSFDARERVKFALRRGDVLVCEGGDVGRAALWNGELTECFYQKALHRVRPWRTTESSKFLYYALAAASWRGAFLAEGNRSTIVHLTAEKLRAMRFPFPPAEEQAAIVSSLDDQTRKLGAATATVTKQIDKLCEYRQALITAAVTGQIAISGDSSVGALTGNLADFA